MAFTTIPGSAAGDATSFIGTAGIDTVFIQNVGNPVFADGQEGNDTIQFQNFTNLVTNYTLKGLDGDDQIAQAGNTNASSSLFNGNKGNDSIALAQVSQSSVFGGDGNDTLTVNNRFSNSLMNGNEGVDTLSVANAISSSIFGGIGNDQIALTAGALTDVVVRADDGQDTITINGAVTTLTSTIINGNAGNDTINIFGITSMTNSTIFGGDGSDLINGQFANGSLVISGDPGNDTIFGSSFADVIDGGDGNDLIRGFNGADTMTGGAGSDNFSYGFFADSETGNVATGAIDEIIDFTGGVNGDRISGFGVAGVGEFNTAGAFGSYASALAGVSGFTTADYRLAAIGSGTSWTAVLFTEIGNAFFFSAQGAIQIGTTGEFGTAAQALTAITAADILA